MTFLRAVSRACPCCGATRAQATRYRSAPPAEDKVHSLTEAEWAGFFKSKVFFSYSRCTACGLLYCPVYFDQPSLTRLYGWMGDNTAGVPLPALRRTQAAYFELVRGRSAGDYLEIGPDIGLFSGLAARARLASRYFLYEPNRAVWPALRSLCEPAGEVVLQDDMSNLDAVPDASIGTAVMIHVLDHLIAPREYLAMLSKKLRPDGLLLIVTHNEASLLARLFGGGYPIFCLQHPQLFSPGSIARTLAAAGLRAREVRRTRNYFPAGYLLKHLLFQLGIDAGRLPPLPPVLGLPLGNIATLAAQPG